MEAPLHRPAPDEPAGKRRRILEAARAVFAQQGFDAARMDEVARRARVSKGTVYNHFESKESLLVEAVLDMMAEGRERLARIAAPDLGPDEALREALRTLITEVLPGVVGERQSLAYQVWALVARDAAARERVFTEFRAFYRAREDELTGPLAAGDASGVFRSDLPADDVSLLLMSIFDGLVYRAMFDAERIDPQRVLDSLLALLDGGLLEPGKDGA